MTAVSPEVVEQVIALRRDGVFQFKIAHDLGIGVASVNRICQKAAREGRLGTKPVLDGFAITQTSTDAEKT